MTEFRWLGENDLAQWRVLRSEALRLYPEAFLTTLEDFQNQSDESVASLLGKGTLLGAFESGRLRAASAFLQLNKAQTRHRAELGAFYVSQSRHRSGLADTLMQKLIVYAQKEAVRQLELYVWDGNPRAIRFYERHGFTEVDRLPNAVIVEGEARDDLFMVKGLPS